MSVVYLDENVKLGVTADEFSGYIASRCSMRSGVGTLAEYTLVDSNLLAKKPDNISFAQAAAFPLAGLTSWHCLVNVGGLRDSSSANSKRVLINGGKCRCDVSRFRGKFD